MAKSKIERGYYPISYSYLKRLVACCESWGYGNKDTCKYVAETTIEMLETNYPDLKIRENLFAYLVDMAHDLNSGKSYTGELLIPVKE